MNAPDSDAMWKIFVSHSTKGTGGFSAALINRLREELSPSYEVLVDTVVLGPGAVWREEIFRKLDEANFAIVILDEAALRSNWVRREVIYLEGRSVNEHTVVFPVLVGLTRSDVEEHDSFAWLMRSQRIDAKVPDGDAIGPAVDEVIAELRTRLAPFDHDIPAPLRKLIKTFARTLKRVDDHDADRLAKLLAGQSQRVSVTPPLISREQLAWRMLDARLTECLVSAVGDVRTEIACAGAAGMFVELISPTWIELAAARPVVPPHRARRHLAVLQTARPRTGKEYVERATHGDKARTRVESLDNVPVGESIEEEIVRDVEKAMLVALRCRHPPGETCDVNRVQYVVVQAGLSACTRLLAAKAVRERCPHAAVLLLINERTDPDRENFAGELGDFVRLDAADPEAENMADGNIDDIRSLLLLPPRDRGMSNAS